MPDDNLGFMPDDTARSRRILEAFALDGQRIEQLHRIAMDLARFCAIPLDQATYALGSAEMGRRRDLQRLGFADLEDVGERVAGQAEAYTTTLWGVRDVARVQRARHA